MDMERLAAETATCDFKRCAERRKPKSWLKSVAAFANTQGGSILFGVDDTTHEPCGVADPQADIEFISQVIHDRIDPVPEFALEVETMETAAVVILNVEKGDSKPYFCIGDGRREVYVRHGDRSELAPREKLLGLVLEGTHRTWDSLDSHIPTSRASFTHLRATFAQRAGIDLVDEDYHSLGLVTEDGEHLTYAGAAFADQPLLRHSRVFAARWDGMDKTHILDTEEYSGGLTMLLHNAEEFIRRYNYRQWVKRVDDHAELLCYSERAITEALVNALVHRNYLDLGSEVSIDIYDDKIEISSPGIAPADIDLEHAADQRQKSHRKNPILADVMGRMKLMERRGSGLMLICQSTAREETYKPQFKPTFKNYCDAFYVTLYNMRWDAQTGAIAQVRLSDLKGVVATEGEAVPGTTQVTDPVTDPVNMFVHALLVQLKESEKSISELLENMGLTHKKSFRDTYLHPALDAGLIERTIPDKPNSRLQKYRLTELGQSTLVALKSDNPASSTTSNKDDHNE